MIDVDGEYVVSIGSKCRVNHGDEELTTGVFKGYSAMGAETMMVIQTDDGTLRFINLAQIIYLDLLEDAPKKQPRKKESGSVYYG